MTMLEGYAHIVECFSAVPWWRMAPHDELVDGGAYCLAEPGSAYLVYLPDGNKTTVRLSDGRYTATWFDPRTGRTTAIGTVVGPAWSPETREQGKDWAVILRREPLKTP
jgi:hypothetical protein